MAWSQLNSRNPLERGIHACLITMCSNAAQACGTQMFRAQDAPLQVDCGYVALLLLRPHLVQFADHSGFSSWQLYIWLGGCSRSPLELGLVHGAFPNRLLVLEQAQARLRRHRP